MLFLNHNNKVLGLYTVGIGGRSGVMVDTKLVFAAALKACASAMMLCHNHPSGSLKPSSEDIRMTGKMVQLGDLLDLPVLDHLIITPEKRYFSFSDEGMI